MHAILVHGLNRTPLSWHYLAAALRKQGVHPHGFGYFAGYHEFDACVERLKEFIETKTDGEPYIVVGHSMGTVLLRAVTPKLKQKPAACFFLAPPVASPRIAKFFSTNPFFRVATREMGQLLSDDQAMKNIPVPEVPTTVYAGVSGARGRWAPFSNKLNDGILSASEMRLPGGRMRFVKGYQGLHSLIMTSDVVIDDIVDTIRKRNLLSERARPVPRFPRSRFRYERHV